MTRGLESARMKRNGGYTFIEILIAMAILIFGIVAIMRMLPIALTEAHLAGEQTVAAHHADAQLGRMRALGGEELYIDSLRLPQRYTAPVQGAAAVYGLYSAYRTNFQRLVGDDRVELQRVVFTLEMPNGRRESFVTYVTKQ
jgi:type II secretory pathway pseudopilin PulG